MLLAFSAWTNGRRLLTVAPPSDSNFTCINGIRFLSAAWVILGHRYRFGLEVPFTNLLTIPKVRLAVCQKFLHKSTCVHERERRTIERRETNCRDNFANVSKPIFQFVSV